MYLRLIYWRFYIALGFWASKEFYMIIYLLCRSLLNLDIYFRHHWSASKKQKLGCFSYFPLNCATRIFLIFVFRDSSIVRLATGCFWCYLIAIFLFMFLVEDINDIVLLEVFWSKMRRSWRWRGIFVSSGSRLAGMRQSAINHFYQVLND